MTQLNMQAAPDRNLEEKKALCRRFLESADRAGSLEAGSDLLAPDFVVHPPSQPPGGREMFLHFGSVMFAAFPDLQHTFDEQIAVGDRVVNRLTMRGTHRGDFQGVPATGRPIEYQAITIYRIMDGKLAELWFVADFLALMQQIGAVPEPGQVPE